MATIYTHADSNIRKTWLLFSLFFVLVIGVCWVFSYRYDNQFILVFGVVFSGLMSFISYWNSDKIVLAMTRAIPIEKKDSPELYNLVENLCITAGLPMPKIFILDEAQPNAFATGRDANHAVIAVTRGLLEKLEKPEIEGVIAHELSHIGNKDMLLATATVILVGFVSLLSNWFLRSGFRRSGRDSREKGGIGGILAILGIILAILSPLFATLLQLSISRKREFLADASGALLTRFPEGLASALEKIARDQSPLTVANDVTAHLYIANPFRGRKLSSLFMTHPPVEERIRILREMNL